MLVDRSFGFVDLCGFTDHLDSRGPQAAADEVLLMRAAVRSAAQANGVRVDKWLGDGAMLVGVDSGPVVVALAQISRDLMLGPMALEVRAGFAHGQVILIEGDDYVGRAVNLAARLCDLAEPGEILVSPAGLVPDAERISRLTVKGFSRAVEVAVLSPELVVGVVTAALVAAGS